jgi:hypothetical protein
MRTSPFQAVPSMLLLALVGSCLGGATVLGAESLSKTEVNKILKDPTLLAGQKDAFDAYFAKEFFPQFTSAGPATDKYVALRRQLRIFLNWGKTGAAHDELNRLTLAKMKEIVGSSKADSASKINAMLVIGELNEVDEPNKPKPLPEAFPLLYGMVATQSPKFKDELKVAALVGIERFAHFAAIPSAKAKDDVTKLMLNLVNQKDPPPNRSRDGHNSMRRIAAQILAKLGGTGPNNNVVNALAAVVADSQAGLTLRCEVALCIGQLKYPPAAKVDLQALANALGYQVLDICTHEVAAAKEANRVPSRRLIVYALHSAREGLSGLQTAAADTPHKKFVSDLADKVKKIHADLDDPAITDDMLAAEVGKKLNELQSVLGPKPAADKEPAAKKEVATAEGKEKPIEPVKQ